MRYFWRFRANARDVLVHHLELARIAEDRDLLRLPIYFARTEYRQALFRR